MNRFYVSFSYAFNLSSTDRAKFGSSNSSDSDDETALPFPKPLARSAFLTLDFSPTDFLSNSRNRHQTLEDLRQELRTRSQDLNKELLDLVNNNYQDFLGLGDSLKGGEEKVEEVRLGLLAFKREIETLRHTVTLRHDEVAKLIEDRRGVVKAQRLGRNLLEVDAKLTYLEESLQLINAAQKDWNLDIGSLDSESDSDEDDAINITRLVYKIQQFIQIMRIVSKIGISHPFLVKQESRISKIKQTLLLDLNNALRTLRTSAIHPQDKILQLLTLYGELGEDGEALKIVKQHQVS